MGPAHVRWGEIYGEMTKEPAFRIRKQAVSGFRYFVCVFHPASIGNEGDKGNGLSEKRKFHEKKNCLKLTAFQLMNVSALLPLPTAGPRNETE